MPVLFLAALLAVLATSCAATPTSLPMLTFERLPSGLIRVTLTPVPGRPVHWTVGPSSDCGAPDGLPTAAGNWPAGAAAAELRAARGDLFTLTGAALTLRDCVPPLAWNSAQQLPSH